MTPRTINDKKYGRIVIVDENEIFVNVYREIDGEDSTFWYPKSKLVPVTERAPKVKPGRPVVLHHPATTNEYSSLVAYLENSFYSLYVLCLPDDVDAVRDEYTSWSGMALPDENIKPFGNRYGREWVLRFKYAPDICYPFPIIEMGMGGGKGEPCGLHRAGVVDMNYVEVVKQLVCAGLRVQ